MAVENNRWLRKLRGGFWIWHFGNWFKVQPHGLYLLPTLDWNPVEAHRRWWTF